MHLLAAITANGFGHAVQTGAVVAALRRRVSGLRVTLRSALPRARLAEVIAEPFDLQPVEHDFGVVIRSASELDLPATVAAYRALTARWDALIGQEDDAIRAAGADLVLANASFAALAGARAAGVACAGIVTVNWADILAGLFPGDAGMQDVARRLHACYADADLLIRPAPSMPFAGARRVADTGPVGTVGANRRADIARRLGLAPDERLVLAALGGMGDAPPVARWPHLPGLRFLVPAGTPTGRHAHDLSALGLPFNDVLASSDAFIGKPGYGSVAGAAVNAVPFLYRRRGDWPEEPYLLDWLETHTRCREIARDHLESGTVADDLDALWRQPPRPAPTPTGAGEIAELLLGLVGR